MIYPIIYGALLLFIMVNLSKTKLSSKLKRYFISLPMFGIFFDFLENIFIIKMLNNYPEIESNLVCASSLTTSLKWSFIVLSILFILFLLISKFSIVCLSKEV